MQKNVEVPCTEGVIVQTVEEYRRYARQCRELAARTDSPNDRKALELQAIAWEKIASQRAAALLEAMRTKKPLRFTP